MSTPFRLIPRLEIKGRHLVKGIHLEGLRVLGEPQHFARTYAKQGADEILCVDVVASLYGRNTALDLISEICGHAFIPLSAGGGIRTLDDIQGALAAGSDKVVINSALVENPELGGLAVEQFGSSTIVASMNVTKRSPGKYEVMIDGGRQSTGIDARDWSRNCEAMGVGEIFVHSIDRDGTLAGLDLDLGKLIVDSVSVPVVLGGGASSASHIRNAVDVEGLSGVSLASMLHYEIAGRVFSESTVSQDIGNTNFLVRLKEEGFGNAQFLPELRDELLTRGIELRGGV